MTEPIRIARYLAHSGVASRRAAERLLAAGRVTVDGAVVVDPARRVREEEEVRVDGRPVRPEPHEVWIVNKPPGVVSTASDPGGRPTVVELVDSAHRLYPVGRLDADSRGLILLTNHGELANRLLHPRYEVRRTYRARLSRPLADQALQRLRDGVELEDGATGPARVRRLGPREVQIEIREGRKRQVRRMVEAVGSRVEDLVRVRFGPLDLGRLPEGRSRRLEPGEVAALWEDARSMPGRQQPDPLP